MKLVSKLFALAAVAGMVASCAGSEKIWRPAGQNGLDLQGKKLLVMPIRANLPGDQNKLNAAIMGGMMGALGSGAISLQPVQPALDSIGLGGFSPLLARGLVWAAWHDGKFGGEFGSIPQKLATLLGKAAEILNMPGLKVDYVIVGHVQQVSNMAGLVKYKVLGGVYCPKTNKIMVAFEYEKSTAESALVGEMAMLGKAMASRIIGEASNPPAKAKVKEEKKAEPAQPAANQGDKAEGSQTEGEGSDNKTQGGEGKTEGQ
ncbi:MAG: hypothetical protein GXP49_17795 [Deltaproteobacteria bacterium]|nr:hypothetical protein [Deltaproteobacteria bacterium]